MALAILANTCSLAETSLHAGLCLCNQLVQGFCLQSILRLQSIRFTCFAEEGTGHKSKKNRKEVLESCKLMTLRILHMEAKLP